MVNSKTPIPPNGHRQPNLGFSPIRRQPNAAAYAHRKQQGMAAVLLVVMLLTIIGLTLSLNRSMSSKTELKIAHNDLLGKQALAIAEAGLQHAYQVIANDAIDGLDDELGSNGTGGTGSGLANISNDISTLPGYRYLNFGGGATGDGYYVRVDDNFDEQTVAENPAADVDGRILITSRGKINNAERVVQATFVLKKTGLFGKSSITLNAGSIVDSYSSAIPPPLSPPHAEVESNANITLNGATIQGNATAVGSITGGGITGTTITGAAPMTFPPVAACAPYSGSTGITGGFTHNTTTGDLAVTGGNTLTLAAPGTYCFNNITFSGGSFLQINSLVASPVTINLTGNGIFSTITNNITPLNAANLKINSGTVGRTLTFSGSGSGAYMEINAPDADLTINGGQIFGTARARTITLSGGSTFHVDENLEENGGGKLLDWHEVQF
jgi:hypothetical protein